MDRFTRLAPSADPATQVAADTFRFVFSNQKVGRDRFVVLNSAIQHQNYDRNNVALWAHDDKQPPIGRGTNIDTSGANCTLDITFVPRDILPFAGTIRDLVAGKWLRAVSLSWQPIEYKPSSDPDIDAIFTEVDMLEVSVVPLPALADALLAARSRGINTRPLAEWAECALETRGYRAVARPELEAIARAASQTPARSSTRAERAARAREIVERGRREGRAACAADMARENRQRRAEHYLRGGAVSSDTSKPKKIVTESRRHLARALKHHRNLNDHHDQIGAGIKEVRAVLTSTLKELGYERQTAVEKAATTSMGVCLRLEDLIKRIKGSHGDACDAGDAAADAIGEADECLANGDAELTVSDQDEPLH